MKCSWVTGGSGLSGLEIGGVSGMPKKIWDTRFTGPGVPKGHRDKIANFSTSVIKATISDVGSKINHQLG